MKDVENFISLWSEHSKKRGHEEIKDNIFEEDESERVKVKVEQGSLLN